MTHSNGSVDKMDQNAKIRLLADQSTVNVILTKKDGDRLICRSESRWACVCL